MKQYQFEIVFIRLSFKGSSSPNLKLSLIEGTGSQESVCLPGCFHQLRLRKLQKIVDLSSLQPFRFSLQQQQRGEDFSLQLFREDSPQSVIDSLPLTLPQCIQEFDLINKAVTQLHLQGNQVVLEVRLVVSKRQTQFPSLQPGASGFGSNLEAPAQLRQSQSGSRSKRPGDLKINTKSILRDSAKASRDLSGDKQIEKANGEVKAGELFKGIADSPQPQVKIIPDKQDNGQERQQGQNALPETLSAWFKPKPKKEGAIKQVEELLQSHHPVLDKEIVQSTKLSIKMKVVIGLLLVGLLLFIADQFKQKRRRKEKSNAKSSKQKKETEHSHGHGH